MGFGLQLRLGSGLARTGVYVPQVEGVAIGVGEGFCGGLGLTSTKTLPLNAGMLKEVIALPKMSLKGPPEGTAVFTVEDWGSFTRTDPPVKSLRHKLFHL